MKTVIVFTRFKRRSDGKWTEGLEYAEVGKKATNPEYKSAKTFLDCIRKMYSTVDYDYQILNVVIG